MASKWSAKGVTLLADTLWPRKVHDLLLQEVALNEVNGETVQDSKHLPESQQV